MQGEKPNFPNVRRPYTEQTGEEAILMNEIRALVSIPYFNHIYRYRRFDEAGEPIEADKENNESTESVADNFTSQIFLLEYVSHLENTEYSGLDFDKTFSMLASLTLPDLNYKSENIFDKSYAGSYVDFLSLVKMQKILPKNNNFVSSLLSAFIDFHSEAENSKEKKVAKSISHISTLLYVVTREKNLSVDMVKDKKEDFAEYVRKACYWTLGLPVLEDLLQRLVRLLKLRGILDKDFKIETINVDKIESEEKTKSNLAKTHFDRYTILHNKKSISTKSEIEKFHNFIKLKFKKRWEINDKSQKEQKETNGDHYAFMLLLAKYFLPKINADRKSQGYKPFTLLHVVTVILGHDLAEGITSDTPLTANTKGKREREDIANETLYNFHLPRLGDARGRFKKAVEEYELGKKLGNAEVGSFVKLLDALDAFMYISTIKHLVIEGVVKVQDRKIYQVRIQKSLDSFPSVKVWWEEMFSVVEK